MAKPSNPREPRKEFKVLSTTQEQEDSYNYVQFRTNVKFTGLLGSVAHMVKGALGGGILSGHVAYMKAGCLIAVPLNFIFGIYMGFCLYLLVISAQILYRRTQIPSMSYSDVGEASMACCSNPKLAKFSKIFRYTIDTVICIDLFGACACYQIIIAKSIKQLVENTHETSIEGRDGYPDLRVYIAAMLIPMILICLITHLKWLAPFSIGANIVVLLCIFMAIYYAFEYNPGFENMKPSGSLYNVFEFIGMTVFSMSCSGVVIAIENNMRQPSKYPLALIIGMTLIVLCTFAVSFFGYVAFLEDAEAPITVNFPMSTIPKILKGLIAVMIYVTHAVNFWVPFNLCFYYIRKRHSDKIYWELLYRAMFVVIIGLVAILFPNINALIGFLGAFCLSNMAFIWPNVINLLVIWERPGLGKYKWRLWRGVIFIGIGVFLFFCGTLVNTMELIAVFKEINL